MNVRRPQKAVQGYLGKENPAGAGRNTTMMAHDYGVGHVLGRKKKHGNKLGAAETGRTYGFRHSPGVRK